MKALGERCKCLKDVVLARALSKLEVERALEDARRGLKSVEAILKRNDKGGLLASLGLTLISFPEPVFSNIAGTTLVVLGLALRKRSLSVKNLVEALREATQLLACW